MTAYHVSQQVAATAPAASTHSQLFINVLQTLGRSDITFLFVSATQYHRCV